MSRLRNHFSGKKILLTGHTGFKGSWMAEWLLSLGGNVVGVSLEPNTEPALFKQLGLEERLEHHIFNICESDKVDALIRYTQPDVVFHLAAQPLVRYSYEHPLETFNTNVMGTAHVLNALRQLEKPCQAVMVTTDKCYENRDADRPYEEDDPMGGHDPYSASKGAAELIISSYRRSFFDPEMLGSEHQVAVASVRAGNVIGGGDWALDRIVPDCMRALAGGEIICVRNPMATRPWQHVLEPLGGYLRLAMCLAYTKAPTDMLEISSGFNFGPDPAANRPVKDLVEQVLRCWPGEWEDQSTPGALHEANLLNLSIEKAGRLLGWSPSWSFETAVNRTVEWYRCACGNQESIHELTHQQIAEYMELFEHDI